MSHLPLIIVDSYIPYIEGLLEPFARVQYLDPVDITPQAVREADILCIRTRTRANQRLLEGSRVSMVCTATIGYDHIDRQWCADHGIEVVSAVGCNAPAVAQYVLCSVLALANRPISQYTIGIVGVGHVGSIVDRWAREIGMDVMRCDPPRCDAGDPGPWFSLQDLARHADVITFHTPLTREGPYPSYHMADHLFFDSLHRHPIVINAARGPVTDTGAFVDAIDSHRISHAVVDCWENEPNIHLPLLERASIATPHIAGYSVQGKLRATAIIVDAIARHLGIDIPIPPNYMPPVAERVRLRQLIDGYNPLDDMAPLVADPYHFEDLRNYYPLRNEP